MNGTSNNPATLKASVKARFKAYRFRKYKAEGKVVAAYENKAAAVRFHPEAYSRIDYVHQLIDYRNGNRVLARVVLSVMDAHLLNRRLKDSGLGFGRISAY